MNEYIKFFGVVGAILLLTVYDVISASPPKTPLPFYSGGHASLSFIDGEAGPPKPIPPRPGTNFPPQPIPQNTRDFVAPKPNQGIQPVGQIGGQTKPNSQLPQNTRDFVAPKPNQGAQSPVGLIGAQPPKPQGAPTPNPPRRDYVAPQIGGQSPNPNQNRDFVAPKPQGPPQNPVQPPKAPTRDYVNPNPPNQSPKDPFPALKPPRNPLNPNPQPAAKPNPSRDFVNPNFKPQIPLNLPKEPFPALKPVGQKGPVSLGQIIGHQPKPGVPNPLPNVPTQKPGSYAEKAANGVTTTRPMSAGTPQSSTKAPDEGPKDNELREFSEQLLKKDVNNAFKFVKLNIQGKTTSQSKNDEAPQNLLEVNQEVFKIPTIAKLKLFYNNYILEVTENEFVTPQEKAEENDFVEAVANTPIMQHTRNFLIANGKISKDPKEFKDLLKTTWFSMYSRGMGRVGSSGFEHIFLAELKKNKQEVSGLHNWLYFHEAEQNKLANYLGYMKKIDLGDKGAILKFHFSMDGIDKPVNSIFVGTSPELEMALYTTCYVFRANRVCPLRLNGNNFIVRAYSMKYRGKQLLGSAFPEI